MKRIVGIPTLFLAVFAFASVALAGEANLTRFGPKVYERDRGAPTIDSATFSAIEGPAKLVLHDDGIVNARIKINGREVVAPKNFGGKGEIVVPLQLKSENTIEVSVNGKPGGRSCSSAFGSVAGWRQLTASPCFSSH